MRGRMIWAVISPTQARITSRNLEASSGSREEPGSITVTWAEGEVEVVRLVAAIRLWGWWLCYVRGG